MQFRLVALIALWTMLSGPVFSGIWAKSAVHPPAKSAVVKVQP